jgi:hypothetical protein
MSSIYYFGAPTKDGQVVSSELTSKGISLLRSSPSATFPLIHREYTTPNYELYTAYFPSAAHGALNKIYTYANAKARFRPTTIPSQLSSFCRLPSIVWNYPKNEKTPDQISVVRERYNAVETVAQGRPALQAILRPDQARSLMETSPSINTPATASCINLSAYRTYLLLHRIAHVFLSVHQYALISENKSVSNNHFKKGVEIMSNDVDTITYNKVTGQLEDRTQELNSCREAKRTST